MARNTKLKSVPNLETTEEVVPVIEFTKDDLGDIEKLMFFLLALHDLTKGNSGEYISADTIADIIAPAVDRLCGFHDQLKEKFRALEQKAALLKLDAFVKEGVR